MFELYRAESPEPAVASPTLGGREGTFITQVRECLGCALGSMFPVLPALRMRSTTVVNGGTVLHGVRMQIFFFLCCLAFPRVDGRVSAWSSAVFFSNPQFLAWGWHSRIACAMLTGDNGRGEHLAAACSGHAGGHGVRGAGRGGAEDAARRRHPPRDTSLARPRRCKRSQGGHPSGWHSSLVFSCFVVPFGCCGGGEICEIDCFAWTLGEVSLDWDL